MGCSSSTDLSDDQVEEYQDCTFFTKREVLHVYKRFEVLCHEFHGTDALPLSTTLTLEQVLSLPELQHNPFGTRMCEVFSADGSGCLTFEDFLDMMSVFSEGATRDVKATYAFRIYDFDGDKYLNESDLQQTVALLCDNLEEEDLQLVTEKVLDEADLDSDRKLSYVEFEHVVSRAPDFVNTFKIRI
eukprot:m.183836 g.183836  ORF g.183836 m.183836 type:complete len:187 (-) comp14701_c0_seq5:309-869(-)